jgi:hypothetical protein
MNSFISIAHASSHISTAQGFVTAINNAILFPIIALLMAVAFIVFLYGAFEYVKNANNDAGRETGRNHLIYGVIGMLVMLSAFAILSMAAATFGLSDELNTASDSSSSFAPSTSPRPVRGPSPATPSVADTYSSLLRGDGYEVNDPRSGVYQPAPSPTPTPAPALEYPDISLNEENQAIFDSLLRENITTVPDAPILEKYNELLHPSEHADEVVFAVNWDNTFQAYSFNVVCNAIPGTSRGTVEVGGEYADPGRLKPVSVCVR